MIIEYDEFKLLFGRLEELKELHNSKNFKEADNLRKILVEKGMKIGFMQDGRVRYSCGVRQMGKVQLYGQMI